MQDDSTSELFRIASDIWQEFIDRREYDAAIESAIATYGIMRARKVQRLARGALNLIHVSIELSSPGDGRSEDVVSCSFCGRGEPDVRLAAGAKAFICHPCVTTLNHTLSRQG